MPIKWIVTAQAIHPETGIPLAPPRDEEIHEANVLFQNCRTLQDVHEIYESFWSHSATELVLVHGIKPVK